MGLTRRNFSLSPVLFTGLIGLVVGSSFVSDQVLVTHGFGGRSLLQVQTHCPISFEFANYTILISQCKAPTYPADKCCAAFKDFACPYADELNDSTNDCATVMFSYINQYGKHPPGLFSSECREGKEGLACPARPSQSANCSSTDAYIADAHINCPLSFEFANYTILTSQCKGPTYPADKCCAAFKEFACPYADEINDQTNDCATTMFSYINLNGKYPPGLFACECREGKGLACPASSPQSANGRSIGAHVHYSLISIINVLVCVTSFLWWLV